MNWNDFSDADFKLVIGELENAIGVTPDRAKQFLEKSRAEGIEQTDVDDAVGDFKHFLRTNHGWGGAVDVAWKYIEPYVRAVVQAAKNAGA